jgi:hypothetical protein
MFRIVFSLSADGLPLKRRRMAWTIPTIRNFHISLFRYATIVSATNHTMLHESVGTLWKPTWDIAETGLPAPLHF